MSEPVLSVVIVSHDDAGWLRPCLDSLRARAGALELEVLVVDNGSDGAHALVARDYPEMRAIQVDNRGFAHANNRGVLATRGRHILFLNPDTELLAGTLAELVAALDARPGVGLIGVRQVLADGTRWPTIRYFPGAARAFGDALALERWPGRPRWAGERELAPGPYERETDCDWVSGSFMLARREAVLAAGLFDERFFLYSEEPDLCLRMRRAGFAVRYLPDMTILHHCAKAGVRPRMVAQDAYTRRQYARKHFSGAHRLAYLGAVGSGHALRLAAAAVRSRPPAEEAAAVAALRTLAGPDRPPFTEPPATALGATR